MQQQAGEHGGWGGEQRGIVRIAVQEQEYFSSAAWRLFLRLDAHCSA